MRSTQTGLSVFSALLHKVARIVHKYAQLVKPHRESLWLSFGTQRDSGKYDSRAPRGLVRSAPGCRMPARRFQEQQSDNAHIQLRQAVDVAIDHIPAYHRTDILRRA